MLRRTFIPVLSLVKFAEVILYDTECIEYETRLSRDSPAKNVFKIN